jgi:hypothetical protein
METAAPAACGWDSVIEIYTKTKDYCVKNAIFEN